MALRKSIHGRIRVFNGKVFEFYNFENTAKKARKMIKKLNKKYFVRILKVFDEQSYPIRWDIFVRKRN